MSTATHEQTTLMLQLFDMRREARLRKAREWFFVNFHAASLEEMSQKFPPMSEANTSFRMVVSYWEMVAAIANRGLLDEDLLFETTGEQWLVWDRIKGLAAPFRAMLKNPHAWENLEKHCQRLDAWREKRAPGSTAAMRQMMEQMQKMAAQEAASGD
jgi:hypothetical protein